MTEENLKDFMNSEKLTFQNLADITNIPLATVQKWGKHSKVPHWMKPFIKNYYKAKELDELKLAMQAVQKLINK